MLMLAAFSHICRHYRLPLHAAICVYCRAHTITLLRRRTRMMRVVAQEISTASMPMSASVVDADD